MRVRRPGEVTVSHYPAGQAPQRFVPGDFSSHRATAAKGRDGATTALGKLIQAGERARFGEQRLRVLDPLYAHRSTGDIREAIESGSPWIHREVPRQRLHRRACQRLAGTARTRARLRQDPGGGQVRDRELHRPGIPGALWLDRVDPHGRTVHLLRIGFSRNGEVHRGLSDAVRRT